MITPALPNALPAAESLYERYAPRVARWAERLAGPSLDVEDIVHEVFAIALERGHKFRGDSSPGTWLFTITARTVSHRRRKERWRRWLAGTADETAGRIASESPDPLRLFERNEAAVEVYLVLDRLRERDRQVLILCELEELGTGEVGDLLGIHQANVRLRLHRARIRFTRAYREFTKARTKTAGGRRP